MATRDEDFLQELRAIFLVEAAEHLQVMATGLLELEKTVEPAACATLVANIFRAAHSLKGAARAADFTEIESSCQALEDTFARWKRAKGPPDVSAFDQVHRALNDITAALGNAPAPAAPPKIPEKPSTALAKAPTENVAKPPERNRMPEIKAGDETVRVSVKKLDAQLVNAEEMLTAKLAVRQRAAELRALEPDFEAWHKEWTKIEPEVRLLRQSLTSRGEASPGLLRLLDYLEWDRDQVKAFESKITGLMRTAEQNSHGVGRLVDDLLRDSKQLLLLPFASVAGNFPKLLRDLCRDQGKEAELVVRGEEVEIDKRILEEMKDPLLHLLRNSVDHGIETPERRIRAGKPARATLTLQAASVDGNKVELSLSDDGAGLDLRKVRESAIKQGIISAEEARKLDEAGAKALIFQAELSTSSAVTKLSGRGLGLAIVREKAEKLGGIVTVESRPNEGTRFRILLPSLLATFRGVLIALAGRRFVVPTFQVAQVIAVTPEMIQTVKGRETVASEGRTLPFVRLAQVLELAEAGDFSGSHPALILGSGDQRIAFLVDAVLDEQEVLVKPLRKPLSRVRNIAGATVLASGEVAPVINVADVLKSAHKIAPAKAPSLPPAVVQTKTVLVAEDSITSRLLLKSVLESAGYKVRTAVDGIDALTLLRTEKYDLLVSDVEMPRLNGLDLTAQIRADRRLAELPVVLVTALESREDRERGIDVGANAYIVKGRFDQSDLLAAVQRLA